MRTSLLTVMGAELFSSNSHGSNNENGNNNHSDTNQSYNNRNNHSNSISNTGQHFLRTKQTHAGTWEYTDRAYVGIIFHCSLLSPSQMLA